MKLSIVGLPIGNIEDISLRAINTIQRSSYLICEDTRMFNNLWTKLVSLGKAVKYEGKIRFINDFNEERNLPRVINELSLEENAVLVSDAGMPLISDPGYKLVRSAIDLNWNIEVVPGPTAESAALAVSGLPTDKYFFVGFLPKKEGKRVSMLRSLRQTQELIKSSLVFYESPMRLDKIMNDMITVFGEEAKVCLAIDLTKTSEKIFRGNAKEMMEIIPKLNHKGEVCIVLSL